MEMPDWTLKEKISTTIDYAAAYGGSVIMFVGMAYDDVTTIVSGIGLMQLHYVMQGISKRYISLTDGDSQ